MKRFSFEPLVRFSPAVLTALCWYPVFSTLVMTLIWQFVQIYYTPFMGGYYFQWIYLYTQDHPDLFSGDLKFQSQILYAVYILTLIAVPVLTVLAAVRERQRSYFAWALCGLWAADCGWILREMAISGGKWQEGVNLAEHLVFLVLTVAISLLSLKSKKTNGASKSKKKTKKEYSYRFK